MIGRFICEYCKNFLDGGKTPDTWKCRAFPSGIPKMKIAFITRETCIDCNNGIGFEPEEIENNDNRP